MTESTLQEKYDALVARNRETCREIAMLTDQLHELEQVFWAAQGYCNAIENIYASVEPTEHEQRHYHELKCAMGPVQQRLCSGKEEKERR